MVNSLVDIRNCPTDPAAAIPESCSNMQVVSQGVFLCRLYDLIASSTLKT